MSDINHVKKKTKIDYKHLITFKKLKLIEYLIANQSTKKASLLNVIDVLITYGFFFLPYTVFIMLRKGDLVILQNLQSFIYWSNCVQD